VPAHVLSVNLGLREPNPAKDVGVTGFRKQPAEVATLHARPRSAGSVAGSWRRSKGA
jgi:hypothetical protein